MSRSTLPKPWLVLAEAVAEATPGPGGALEKLRRVLDMSQSTFHRVTHGTGRYPADKVEDLRVLCEMLDVPSPLTATPTPPNFGPIRMLGEALAMGLPPAKRTLDRLRAQYTQDQLTQLAESDAPSEVLRAVTILLEEP